ncbi:MAG: hypothetical protein KA144_04805 [Xanthomonadaceae bacterium]|nr:hypothetical protein [Xanthomonadaceae bacterium]
MSAVIDLLLERLTARRLATAARAAEETTARRTLFVVVREPDLQALARGLARLLALTAAEERAAWLANFTKVRLFAGHPGRAAVAPLLRCVESDVLGFALVDAEARHPRLADLLVPLRTREGPAPDTELEVTWDDGEGRWELEIDATGLDWPRYLVHVLHLLAEAALGDPGFGGRIALLHRASPPVCDETVAQLRLDLDASPPACRATLRPRRAAERG